MTTAFRASILETLARVFPPLTDVPATSGEQTAYEFAKAAGSYQAYVDEIGGVRGKVVMDFGCGWGGETLWLAQRAARVVGCDINAEALDQARQCQARWDVRNVQFVQSASTALPLESDSVDAVFSTNVFEHVMQPAEALSEIRRVLKPGGCFVSTFGPLFYSPLGYHLPWATQVPYAHLLFGLAPILRVRNRRRSPIDVATWQDTGLNRMTFFGFRQAVKRSGFKVERLRRIAVRGLNVPARMPLVGNLLTFGVDCHLIK